jgi:hypothetical protein
VRRMASSEVERLALLPQLATPRWFDSVRKEPKL